MDRRSSSCGDGEREADLTARSSFPFSTGEAERLRDFFSHDISFERLRESRSDFTLERLFERDLDFRSAEREWDLRDRERDLDLADRERERDLRLRECDLRSPDLERDFRPDLEREWRRLLLLWERDLEWDLERLLERLLLLWLLRLLLRERRRLRDLERLPEYDLRLRGRSSTRRIFRPLMSVPSSLSRALFMSEWDRNSITPSLVRSLWASA